MGVTAHHNNNVLETMSRDHHLLQQVKFLKE